MSRESRDGRKPHESEDDVGSDYSAEQNDQDEDLSQEESQDSRRHDHEHRKDYDRLSDAESHGGHEHHARKELQRYAGAIVVRRRGSGNPATSRRRSLGLR